ncbi:MAG: hypothetical protein V3S43_03455 [Acidimicrobiia bacterium]
MANKQDVYVIPPIGTQTLVFDMNKYLDSSISEEIATITSVTITGLSTPPQTDKPTVNGAATLVTPANVKIAQQFKDTSPVRELGNYNVEIRFVTDKGSPDPHDHTHHFLLIVKDVGKED